jgi:hypothetical protein
MIRSTTNYFRSLLLACLLAFLVVVVSACSGRRDRLALKDLPAEAKAILVHADELDLYSLEPLERASEGEQKLRGWKVLGKTTFTSPAQVTQLLAALDEGLADPQARGAKCFDPRHAIRGSWQGKTAEVLVCFECGWAYVYLGGGAKAAAVVEMSRAPERTFNRLLTDAGLPLAKERPK